MQSAIPNSPSPSSRAKRLQTGGRKKNGTRTLPRSTPISRFFSCRVTADSFRIPMTQCCRPTDAGTPAAPPVRKATIYVYPAPRYLGGDAPLGSPPAHLDEESCSSLSAVAPLLLHGALPELGDFFFTSQQRRNGLSCWQALQAHPEGFFRPTLERVARHVYVVKQTTHGMYCKLPPNLKPYSRAIKDA